MGHFAPALVVSGYVRFICLTLPNISKTTSNFTLNLQFKYYSTKNCDFKLYFAVFAEHFRYFDL